MQALAYATIIVVMLSEYLQTVFHLPRSISWLPEIASIAAALLVVVHLAHSRFRYVDARYVFLFGLLLLHVVAGIVANHLPPGVVFSGLRVYIKALPFFLLPLVMSFTDRDLKRQMLLIAAICLIQLPIAWQQRMHDTALGWYTGDHTVGTLQISSMLSIFICCTTAIAVALYLKRRLSIRTLMLFLALTVPCCMINETKGTMLLLPVAVIMPFVLAGSQRTGFSASKRMILSIVLVAGFFAAFIPIYDAFMKPRWGYGIIEFLTMEGRVEDYLVKDSKVGAKEVGKLDSLVLPFTASNGDPAQLTLGLGIGNVSPSSFGPGFEGTNFKRYGKLVGPDMSLLLWEIGWFGAAVFLCLLWTIFRDSLVARHSDTLGGAIALGWTGVLAVTFIGMFYANQIHSNAFIYLFWFYSGVVVRTAMELREESAAAVPSVYAREVALPRARVPSPALSLRSGRKILPSTLGDRRA